MCCGVTLSWPLRWPRAALYQGGTVWGVLISQGVVSSQAKKTRFLALSGVFQFQDSLLCTPPWGGGGVGYPMGSGLGTQWEWGWVSHWVGYSMGSGLGTHRVWVGYPVGVGLGIPLGWVPHRVRVGYPVVLGQLGWKGGRRWV